MMKETLEDLIEYCKENNRICLMPNYWNELYDKLKNKKQIETQRNLIDDIIQSSIK